MDARSPAEVIAPSNPRQVTLVGGSLEGRVVTVRPLNITTLPEFVRVIRPAFGALVALAPASSSPGAAGGQGTITLPNAEDVQGLDVLNLVAEHGHVMAEAVALTSDLSLEDARTLELDDAMELALRVWEVNRDFFTQRVFPLLRKGLGRAL